MGMYDGIESLYGYRDIATNKIDIRDFINKPIIPNSKNLSKFTDLVLNGSFFQTMSQADLNTILSNEAPKVGDYMYNLAADNLFRGGIKLKVNYERSLPAISSVGDNFNNKIQAISAENFYPRNF